MNSVTNINTEGSVVMDLDMYSDRGDEEEEEEEEEESEDEIEYKVNQKRMRRDETDNDERLYCFCQQVSYGDMVACDGQVS